MAASLIPSNWVLADLFDVTTLELQVPDHVLEDDPSFGWVAYPSCDGERWVMVAGSAWGNACRAAGRPDLDYCYRIYFRCHGEGEALSDFPHISHPLRLAA